MSSADSPVITVRHLSKRYAVYARPRDLLYEIVARKPRHEEVWALRDVSIEIGRREVVGIIGPNGSGKSTLLRILAGTLDASSGSARVEGRISAILELGTGFHPEYTGRENVVMGGMCLGMTRDEVLAKQQWIIDFSGVGEFIDRPFRTYSSGMQARLTFATATAVDPDVLIVDEALAAGDAVFVQKSFARVRELCSGGRTALLVSHSTGTLAQVCSRVIWLDRGRVHMDGDPLEVVRAYDLAVHVATSGQRGRVEAVSVRAGSAAGGHEPASGDAPPHTVFRAGPFEITRLELLDREGRDRTDFVPTDSLTVRVHYRCDGPVPDETLGLALAINRKGDLLPVLQCNTNDPQSHDDRARYAQAPFRIRARRTGWIEGRLDPLQLAPGEYLLSVGLLPNLPDGWQFYEYHHLTHEIRVLAGETRFGGLVYPIVRWDHRPTPETVEAPEPSPDPPATLYDEIREACAASGHPDAWPRHAGCPCCGGTRTETLFSKLEIAHSICRDCQFVFVDPHPPPAVLDRLYAGRYYSGVRRWIEQEKTRSRRTDAATFSFPPAVLDRLIERATEGRSHGRWLDVGGGIGSFANRVAMRRPGWSVVLHERTAEVAALASGDASVGLVSGDLADLRLRLEPFDVVSSISVAEHEAHPATFLREQASLLRPGGLLVVAVPRFSPLNRLVSRANSANVIPPFHLSFFDEPTLRSLVERHRLGEIVETWIDGPPAFDLTHFLEHWQHFDVAVPTAPREMPECLQVSPYEPAVADLMARIGPIGPLLEGRLLELDGGLYLTMVVRRPE